MAFPFAAVGPILSGIGSIGGMLGGLFGKKKKPTVITPAMVRRQAIAGGFNPLTVLTKGGGLNPGIINPVPSLSSLEVIGNAMQNLGTSVGGYAAATKKNDPVMDETARLENELLKVRIDNARDEQKRRVTKATPVPPATFPNPARVRTVTRSPERRTVDTSGPEPVVNNRPPKPPHMARLEEGDDLLVAKWDGEQNRWVMASPANDVEEMIGNFWQRTINPLVQGRAGRKYGKGTGRVQPPGKTINDAKKRMREAERPFNETRNPVGQALKSMDKYGRKPRRGKKQLRPNTYERF